MSNVKNLVLVVSLFVLVAYSMEVRSASLTEQVKALFQDGSVEVNKYNDQLYSVWVDSERVYLVSADGKYLYGGPVLDIRSKTDIVESLRSDKRKKILQSLKGSDFINYPAHKEMRHEITVVTDVDCGYCRAFHNSLPILNGEGVSVNYVMLPRAGIGSNSFIKTQNAICSDDPAESLTLLMQSSGIERNLCDDIKLKTHLELARRLGVSATPTIIFPDGTLHVGNPGIEHLMLRLEGGI